PLAGSLTLNPALALYLVAAALATGLVFSLAPILLAARVSFRARSGSGRHRLHATLIVAEVGLAMALLTASGLMLHSIVKLNRVDLGFNPDHLLTATVSTSRAEAAQPGGVTRFFATLRQRAASLPGVQSVAVVFPVPYTTQIANCFVAMPGHAPDPNAPLTTYYFNVSADYFRTMQQALLKGRTFTPADDQPGAPPVAIVDASLAREYYGSVDKALGSQIQMFTQTFTPAPKTGRPPATIVGIVASIKAEGPDVASHRELYVPLSQPNGGMTLVLRTASSDSAAPLTPAVRNIVHQMDP